MRGSRSGATRSRATGPGRTATTRYPDAPPPRNPSSGDSFAMSTVIDTLERAQLRRVPKFQAGDRVRVHFQVIEGTRRRTQVFEGVVIKRQGEGVRETFTVRKNSFGVGVERTFPVHSPKIERIEAAAEAEEAAASEGAAAPDEAAASEPAAASEDDSAPSAEARPDDSVEAAADDESK